LPGNVANCIDVVCLVGKERCDGPEVAQQPFGNRCIDSLTDPEFPLNRPAVYIDKSMGIAVKPRRERPLQGPADPSILALAPCW